VVVETTLGCITKWIELPGRIEVENGRGIISQDFDRWSYWNHGEMDFIRPGTPADRSLGEVFISQFLQECLIEHCLISLNNAQTILCPAVQYRYRHVHHE
jgi:hypothetical protein